MTFGPTTRSFETESRYRNRIAQLCSQARKYWGFPSSANISPIDLVDYLIARKPTISKATWRQYKSAVLFHLEEFAELLDSSYQIEEALVAQNRLKQETQNEARRRGIYTSALKQKSLKQEDLQLILEYLNNHLEHQYSKALSTWLQAGLLTGLRPCEWANARLHENHRWPALIIENAKATNNRANGKSRTLELKLSQDKLLIIRAMIQIVAIIKTRMPFEAFQKGVSQYMSRVARACLGTRKKFPTLYSTRHQVAANAKLQGFSTAEVAAILGHACDETAGKHYARKVQGESALGVFPMQSETLTVREKNRAFPSNTFLKNKANG